MDACTEPALLERLSNVAKASPGFLLTVAMLYVMYRVIRHIRSLT